MPQEQTGVTQQFVDIDTIQDGVVILKSGGLRQIIMVTGINFDLKSEDEQNLIIGGYQNMLNTLDFTVQFFIHSRKLNIDKYLKILEDRQEQETNNLLKDQISEYREFIRSFVEENTVMTKTFFVVVPYDYVQITEAVKSFSPSRFLPFLGRKEPKTGGGEGPDFSRALPQLRQRVDQVIAGLSNTGLRAVPLNTEEATELFYNLYNPSTIEKSGLAILKQE